MLETQPFELICVGPTSISQILSPFAASPPKVLLGEFRSRCHIVVKDAFPLHRVHQGMEQLIKLYSMAGFSVEELNRISSQILMKGQLKIKAHLDFHHHWPTLSFCAFGLNSVIVSGPCLIESLGSNSLPWSRRSSSDPMDRHQRQIHVHRARDEMKWEEIGSDEITWNDTSTDCWCDARKACPHPIGTVFVWNFRPRFARVLLVYSASGCNWLFKLLSLPN